MHDEAGFLSAIRQTPADDISRLVFADWLDEQDDPACKIKAEFVRFELPMVRAPEGGTGGAEALANLRSLAAQIPPLWLAVVSHAKIEWCQHSTKFNCPGRWELLAPTSFDDMRRCRECKRVTPFCTSIDDARMRIQYGNSVALSPAVFRWVGDLGGSGLFGRGVRLTPAMIERLRTARARSPQPAATPPPPLAKLPAREWLPHEHEQTQTRPNREFKRKPGRTKHRNIQRDNWEDAD